MDVFTKASNLLGERRCSLVQQAEAGSDELILLQRSCDFLYNTLTTTNSLDIFVGVFHLYASAFQQEILVFLHLFSIRVCRV